MKQKKKEVKPQPKKEYKEVPQKKKELLSDPDSKVSVCLSREQLFRIRQKMTNDEAIVNTLTAVLDYKYV